MVQLSPITQATATAVVVPGLVPVSGHTAPVTPTHATSEAVDGGRAAARIFKCPHVTHRAADQKTMVCGGREVVVGESDGSETLHLHHRL